MTRNASFIRKVVYICLIGVLLLPLYYLSQPSGVDVSKHKGGKLDQLRRQYDLSQSSLGEVDPTSETMKLATLGMRGIATTILWHQANEHKKKENWDAFGTVLRQISKLQPHFIKVWIFQAWNQSYNVSVEFDHYEYRYHWVKKGINYLVEGTRYNQRDVRLQSELGRVFGHKIGRSDEHLQFRRLFRVDDDFHKDLPINPDDPDVEVRDYRQEPNSWDNWLVGREFCLRAIRISKSPRGSKDIGASPVLFYSEPVMKRMSYGEAIIDEGYFGDAAQRAWVKSDEEWKEYGDVSIRTSIPGIHIKLNDLEEVDKRIADLDASLRELAEKVEAGEPDIREKIRQDKMETLNDQERKAINVPEDDRDDEQKRYASQAEAKLEILDEEIIRRGPKEIGQDAARAIIQRQDLLVRRRYINSYRNIVNFEYWATRCEAEQQQTMLDARRHVFEAAQLHREGKLSRYPVFKDGKPVMKDGKQVEAPGAKEVYEQAWEEFATIYRQYPVMLDNPETEDLLEHVKDYQQLLGQLNNEKLPPNFKMQIILDMYDTVGQRRADSETLINQWVVRMDALQRGDPRMDPPRPPVPPMLEVSSEEEPVPTDAGDPRSAVPKPPVVE